MGERIPGLAGSRGVTPVSISTVGSRRDDSMSRVPDGTYGAPVTQLGPRVRGQSAFRLQRAECRFRAR